MSRRPHDWSPVRRSSDPTPGDPDALADLAARYRRTAEAIAVAADGLHRISGDDSYHGRGGEKLRERAVGLERAVRAAHERYAEAAQALDGYHPELHAAQVTADAALARAREAEAEERAALAQLDALDRAPVPPDETPQAAAERARARAAVVRRLEHAREVLRRAEQAVAEAESRQDEAAAAAAARIHHVNEHDGLKDSWKDDLGGVMKVVADVAGAIAAVCGVLALLVGWIPVVGQALAAVLGTVALVASIVSLLANLTLKALGKGAWRDVLLDAVSVATFGLARAFMAAGKLTAAAARSQAWHAALRLRSAGQVSGRVRVLVGSRLQGAHQLGARAPATWWKPGVLSAYRPGALADDLGSGLSRVRTSWQALPSSPSRYVADARATFSAAYAAGGYTAVGQTLLGAGDDVADLTRLKGMHELVRRQPEVHALLGHAAFQTRIGIGSGLAGAGVDVYQATELVQEDLRAASLSGPPAVAEDGPAPPGGTRSPLPPGFESPSASMPPPVVGPTLPSGR